MRNALVEHEVVSGAIKDLATNYAGMIDKPGDGSLPIPLKDLTNASKDDSDWKACFGCHHMGA